jgi:hypothetical protein
MKMAPKTEAALLTRYLFTSETAENRHSGQKRSVQASKNAQTMPFFQSARLGSSRNSGSP